MLSSMSLNRKSLEAFHKKTFVFPHTRNFCFGQFADTFEVSIERMGSKTCGADIKQIFRALSFVNRSTWLHSMKISFFFSLNFPQQNFLAENCANGMRSLSIADLIAQMISEVELNNKLH